MHHFVVVIDKEGRLQEIVSLILLCNNHALAVCPGNEMYSGNE